MIDFDDMFKDHWATYEKLSDQIETLKWKKPGRSTYALYYIRWGSTLMVFGDCSCAMYRWCPAEPGTDEIDQDSFLQWVASRANLHYFVSKCVAPPVDGLYDWDGDLARQVLENMMDDYDEDDLEEGRKGSDKRSEKFIHFQGYNHLQRIEDWTAWLEEHGSKVFGSTFWDSQRITNPGKALNVCVRIHHEGLKRAMAQVRAQQQAAPATPEGVST